MFIRSQNVGWGFLDLADVAYLDFAFNEVETKSVIMAGDILSEPLLDELQ